MVQNSQPRVSVIIPAYNAEKTLEETLNSVVSQSYKNIEVVVVDDGSTDRTAKIVEKFSQEHQNIRLVQIQNSGVAKARNAGIKESQGKYVAPIDADDLWHPKRIEMHVQALENADQKTAVAYSPFCIINPESEIIGYSKYYGCSGNVFYELLETNIVGNGSGLLVRKDALESVGGYSPALQAQGAEGCEDYLVQLKLAYDYKYVCVPHHLIGYRLSPGNMSSDKIKMKRSEMLMYDRIDKTCEVDQKLFKQAKLETLSRLLPFVVKKHGYAGYKNEIKPHLNEMHDYVILFFYTLGYISSRISNKAMRLLKKIGHYCPKEKKSFYDFVDYQLQDEMQTRTLK